MENLENEFVQIHQEVIRREANIKQALKQSGVVNPQRIDRGLSLLGDTLVYMGTRIKERRYTRVTVEESSVPSFLIML